MSDAAPIQPEIPVEPKTKPRRIRGSATMSVADIAKALNLTPVQHRGWSAAYLKFMQSHGLTPLELPLTYSPRDWDAIKSFQVPLRERDGTPVLKNGKPVPDKGFTVPMPERSSGKTIKYVTAYTKGGISFSYDNSTGEIESTIALPPLEEIPFPALEEPPPFQDPPPLQLFSPLIPEPVLDEPKNRALVIDGTLDERSLREALTEFSAGTEIQESPPTIYGPGDEPYRFSIAMPAPEPVPPAPEPEPMSRGAQIRQHLGMAFEIAMSEVRDQSAGLLKGLQSTTRELILRLPKSKPAAENEPQAAESDDIPDNVAEFSPTVPGTVEAAASPEALAALKANAKLLAEAASPRPRPQQLSIFEIDPEGAEAPESRSAPAKQGPVLVAKKEVMAPLATEISSASAAITLPTAATEQLFAPSDDTGTAQPAASATKAGPRTHANGEVDWDPQSAPSFRKRIGALFARRENGEQPGPPAKLGRAEPSAAVQSELNL